MMRDNRVAKIADDLWDTAAKEVKSAISIPDSTYALLGKLCDRPGAAVKDDCINAAHISFHFFHRRVLVPAGELPWCLCRGDIERNLDDLAAQECPDEPVSKNLWLLMQRRFHKVQLVKTVATLWEAGMDQLASGAAACELGAVAQVAPGVRGEDLSIPLIAPPGLQTFAERNQTGEGCRQAVCQA